MKFGRCAAYGLEHLAPLAIRKSSNTLNFTLVLLALGGGHAFDSRRQCHCVYSGGSASSFQQLHRVKSFASGHRKCRAGHLHA